jgi:hypothetical protein
VRFTYLEVLANSVLIALLIWHAALQHRRSSLHFRAISRLTLAVRKMAAIVVNDRRKKSAA